MHHLVAQLAHVDPGLCVFDEIESLGAIKVVDKSGDSLAVGDKVCREEFVPDRVLQPTKAGHKGFHALRQILVIGERAGAFDREGLCEQATIGGFKPVHFALDDTRKVLQASGGADIDDHSTIPSRRAAS
jgi:hypothetical protein